MKNYIILENKITLNLIFNIFLNKIFIFSFLYFLLILKKYNNYPFNQK